MTGPAESFDAAVARVAAYLDEMDRVDAANRGGSRYADDVHGINDRVLLRSDLRAILSGIPAPGVTL